MDKINEWKRDKYANAGQIVCYFQQVAAGVVYIHKQNLIHLDIKPDNILIDNENKVAKITDFSLSKRINKEDSKV